MQGLVLGGDGCLNGATSVFVILSSKKSTATSSTSTSVLTTILLTSRSVVTMYLTDRAGAILRHHTHSSQVKDTTVTAHWSAIGNGGGGEGEGEARDWARSCCCVRSLPCCSAQEEIHMLRKPSYLAFSSAPYEPGEATTRVPSVAYGLGVTK